VAHESHQDPPLPFGRAWRTGTATTALRWICLASLAGIFALDCLTTAGIAIPAFYSLSVFAARFTSPDRRFSLGVVICVTVLIVVGGFVSPSADVVPLWLRLPNRAISIAVAWAVWVLGDQFLALSRELELHERRFRVLIDGIRDVAIIMLDPRGGITIWNRGAEEIFGYGEAEVLGRLARRLLEPESAEIDELKKARDNGRFESEGWRCRKDGSRIWVRSVLVPLEVRGQAAGFAMAAVDLTLRKTFEAERQRTLDELQRSNSDLEQFAYVASHDLQEPLRAVSGCVQLLHKKYHSRLDVHADELIGHAVAGVERMQALINGLLAYARVTAQPAVPTAVDSDAVARRVLVDLCRAIDENNAVVVIEPLPTVLADPIQLGQVFQNLIGNALKFHGNQPPNVHVHAIRDGPMWKFAVRDRGIGIDQQYTERIFALFQRLHSRKDYPGSGIGLSLCKKIVERYGGRIWVESTPGDGATFFFTLPSVGDPP
jgi:PAS domain S-box-containing protein